MKNKKENLLNLIENYNSENIRKSFTSKETGTDPVTGAVSWDITYSPVREIEKGLEKVIELHSKLLEENPEDKKLEKMFQILSNYKKSFKTHITRNYGK